MYNFENLIEEIEQNLLGEIDIEALSRRINLSVYEFRRIFTFVTGMPVGEYIRKRRLSLAALELFGHEISITDIAGKYGYDSPSSFSRAFKEFHKLTPADVMSGDGNFHLLTKIHVEIAVSGCSEISYSIKECPGFWVGGISGHSDMTDSECCEDVWNRFYEHPAAEELISHAQELYAVYQNAPDAVHCTIGSPNADGPDRVYVPKSLWACFPVRGTEDATVNAFYGNVLERWFSSVGFERATSLPNLEIFPADMSEDDFPWEIRIPIQREKKHENT